MLLPGWLLIMASSAHGSPSLTSAATLALSVIVTVGGLAGAGLGLMAITNRSRAEASMQAWVADLPAQTSVQNVLGLIGGLVFLAAGYQVVSNWDVFSQLVRDRGWFGRSGLTSWDTLLILCGLQFAFFFAQANLTKRPEPSPVMR